MLHYAIERECGDRINGRFPHVDFTAYLLTVGANALHQDASGQSPLDLAREQRHWLAWELMEGWLGLQGGYPAFGSPS